MPASPGIDLPGIPQHVVQRGTDRRPCFFQPIDHRRYLDEPPEPAVPSTPTCTNNHLHLFLTPGATGQVDAMVQALGRRYVHDRYDRIGTL